MKKTNVRKHADRDASTLVIESLMVLFYISLTHSTFVIS